MKLITSILLMTFAGLPSVFGAQSKETAFWAWFQRNDERLFAFEKDRDRIFDELSGALIKVDPNLTFEFGPVREGRREFVISAGGIRRAFPAVEALAAAAPKLDRWVILKYRQRRQSINDLEYAGVKVPAGNVRYPLFKDEDPGRVGVLLFMNGYKEEERKSKWGQIGYLFLDDALGEYDVEMRVGAIIMRPYGAEHFDKSRPLSELPTQLDGYFQARRP